MNKIYRFRIFALLAAIALISGCLPANNGGTMAGNNGTYGLGSTTTNNGTYGLGSTTSNSSMSGLQNAVISAIIQSMASSVFNGQIGSQLAPADQNFRLQQLGGLVQSGSVNQAQQWVNPQTGNTMMLNPIGQQSVNPQTRQQCRSLQETIILQNGNRISENRLACIDPQTGKWNLVQ